MRTYKIDRGNTDRHTVWTIGFGEPARNAEIVQELAQHLKDEPPHGGGVLLIDGPASLPVAGVIFHAVAHLYAAVAVRDPKEPGRTFVVCISHDPVHAVGSLIAVA